MVKINQNETDLWKLTKRTSRISVTEFGAIGDGVTDDSEKVNNAIKACIGLKTTNKIPELYFPYCKGFATTESIIVPSGISVVMDSPLIYTGKLDEICLTIGESNKINQNVKLVLQAERSSLSNWDNESNIGIRITNAYESDINILKSKYFTIGVQFMGDSKGCVYNEITLYSLIGNKIGLDLTSKGNGWTNENNFYGGRFAVLSGQNNGKSRYGIRLTSENGYMQNNNLFVKPSFELNNANATPNEAIPILMEYGSQNTFLSSRSERNSINFARVLNGSTENKFNIGYGSHLAKIEELGTFPASLLEVNRRWTIDKDGKLLFSIHNLHHKACYYNEAGAVNIAGVFGGNSVSADISKYTLGTIITDDYIELGIARSIGVMLDTRNLKKFIIRREIISGHEGRVAIRCYDAKGKILNDTDINHPYVRSMSYSAFNFVYSYGGVYQTGIDNPNDLYISLHENVAKISILFINGTKKCRIRGFSIYSLEGKHASVSCGYEEIIPNVNLGVSAPTAGNWEKGKLILNDNKIELGSTGYKYVIDGWECILSGTPGIWIEKRSWTGK